MSRQPPSISAAASLPQLGSADAWEARPLLPLADVVPDEPDGLAATAGRGMLALFDQGVVSGTSFVTSVLIGHACSAEDLGGYYLALSLVLFVRGIQERIISAPYMVYCARRAGNSGATYAASSLVHQGILSAASLLVMLGLLAAFCWSRQPAIPPLVIATMGAALPFLLLREYVRQFAFAHLEFHVAAILDVIVAVLQLGSLLGLAYWRALTVPWIYGVMGGSCALAGLCWYGVWRPPLKVDLRHVVADWWHNWAFGKWVLASQLLTSVAPCALPWLLNAVHGNAATGEFAACSTLVGFANVLVTGLANQLTPEAATAFAHGGSRALGTILRRALIVFTLTVGCLCLVFLVAGNWLIVLVYGNQFAGSGWLLTILGLALLARCVEMVAGNGLWALERPAANLYGDVANLVVNLALVGCLVGRLGALALAWAALAGSLVGAVVRHKTLTRILATFPAQPGIPL